jgi:AcrR family transcriptional regulator
VAAVKQGRRASESDIARRRRERRLASGRRSDQRWLEILGAASTVFRRLGYPRATLDDVAGEVGLHRATLYYYVGTKEELLVALLQDPLEKVRVRLEEVAAQALSAPDKLAATLREYVRTMDEHPELFIFLSENVHNVMSGPEAERIRANADQYGRVLAGVIADGAEAGEFRTDIEPRFAVLGIIGMFNWIHRWYRPEGGRSLTEIGEDFVAMALSSVAPPSQN